jgi:hypothetical protein
MNDMLDQNVVRPDAVEQQIVAVDRAPDAIAEGGFERPAARKMT